MTDSTAGKPLLAVRGVSRSYVTGETLLTVLRDVDLTIDAGEMVAIVGASGSGKSTLMNILGCLDQPSAGTYSVGGHATGKLDADALAQLRREHFGFVFQRYQLLGAQTALGNVETPAVYAGIHAHARRERATALLGHLGLGERLDHRPSQLSGGQQQRVSIARALMNGGQVILADEPTGALDSKSGADLMALFARLHAAGHTIIIVTHDMDVARHAGRIVEIKDGRIVADYVNVPAVGSSEACSTSDISVAADEVTGVAGVVIGGVAGQSAGTGEPALDLRAPGSTPLSRLRRLGAAFRLAVTAVSQHRLRAFLTMLGIIIGTASVVCVVALGEGSRQRIVTNLSAFGSNTIDIFPGTGAGDIRAARVETLSLRDVDALRAQSYIDSVTPVVTSSATLRYRNKSLSATVNGVNEQFFQVHNIEVGAGKAFDATDVKAIAQTVMIDERTRAALFGGDPAADPALGKEILVDDVPCRVSGVASTDKTGFGRGGGMLNVWMPYTAVMTRMTGSFVVKSVTIRVADGVSGAAAIDGVSALLEQRHGKRDFTTWSSDSLLTMITQASDQITLLIAAIAFISLLVGGIGVMNIMLVTITERIHEIGVRMAVGARRSDIRDQFLIEAVLICLLGGGTGIALALGIGAMTARLGGSFNMIFSLQSIATAFGTATLIGITFGFMPAMRAARMNPVDALSRE